MSKREPELQRRIKKLNSELDENLPTLNCKIKELNGVTDELESVHRATTVGSLVGTAVGAASGITAALGMVLAPFTFGASLALTGVGVAGAVTGTACGIANMVKQNNILQTIKTIIDDFHNKINPILEELRDISNVIEEIQKRQQISEPSVPSITVGSVEAVLGVSSMSIEFRIAKLGNVVKRSLQMAGKIISRLSSLLLIADVYFIVQDSKELYEMDQLANKKKRKEEIKSETLKCIVQMRETAALFQETVDEIRCDNCKLKWIGDSL